MSTTMNCPACGTPMNHHCDKLVYVLPAHPEKETPMLDGGALLEFHSCPSCGSSTARMPQ